MRSIKPSARVVAVSALIAGLSACTAATMTPTWEKWFSAFEQQQSRYETVHNVIYDPAGAVISVASSSSTQVTDDVLVIIKQDTRGNLLWKKTADLSADDHPWDAVLGTDGSVYVVTENSLVKFSSGGVEQWRRNISTLINGNASIRDLELSNNRLYVAGRDLYVFDINGNLTNTVTQIAPLWDVAISGNSVYIAGSGQVKRYTSSLSPVWSYAHSVVQNPPAEMAIAADGSVYVATFNANPQDSAYLTKLNNNGVQVWSKFFNDPDTSSYQLPGIPKVRLLPNGNLAFIISQHPTRILNVIDPANGAVKYSNTQKTGVVNEMEVDNKGGIYVVGAKTPQKFDSTATLLANGTFPGDADITSGGLAFTADAIYVGAGVYQNGNMKMYVSRYTNQQQ